MLSYVEWNFIHPVPGDETKTFGFNKHQNGPPRYNLVVYDKKRNNKDGSTRVVGTYDGKSKSI